MLVNLSDITVQKRGRKELGDISGLAESFKLNKQITPITIRPARPDDLDFDGKPVTTKWVLLAGGRRFLAATTLGWEQLDCKNFGDLPPLEQKIIELEENLQRKEMTWSEEDAMRSEIHRLRTLQATEAGATWTARDTARELGEHPATISRAIKVTEAIKNDPHLRNVGSKGAALRIIDMREHLQARERRGERGVQDVRDVLVLQDCRIWLPTLATASVDMVLTDPPYGIDFDEAAGKVSRRQKDRGIGRGFGSGFGDGEEATKDMLTDVIPEMMRILKPTGWLVMFQSDFLYDFAKLLMEDCCLTHFEYRDETSGDKHCIKGGGDSPPCTFGFVEEPRWLWYRPNSKNLPHFPDRHVQSQYEPMLVFNRGKGRILKQWNGTRPVGNVLEYDSEYGDRIHTTQKPVALASEVAERLTIVGDLVVDPFFGSGSLLAGVAVRGRKIAGCEVNDNIFEQAIAHVVNVIEGREE